MHDRRNLDSGAEWEGKVGYSRAVRVGKMIFVSGTTAADPEGGPPVGGTDAGEQASEALRRIDFALNQLGSGLGDVVRTRIYVTNISDWPAIGEAHRQFFGATRPASTMVEVSALISEDLLVEIEADAVVA